MEKVYLTGPTNRFTTMKPLCLFATLLLVGTGCTAEAPPDGPPADAVRIVETISTDDWNSDLVAGDPTVDVGIYLPETDDERYTTRVPLDTLMARFEYARDIFGEVGVQLNMLWIKKYVVPDTAWLTIQSNRMQGEPGEAASENLYERMRVQRSTLTEEAERVFDAIIEPDERNDRTVYVVGLRDVFMSFYEQNEDGEWVLETIPTNALSFPTYSLEDRIPRRLRGVISIQNAFISRKVIAHELGHKLMNVSHEYRDLDPQNEIDAEGGLMVYGEGIDIPSGEAGRWHLERLMRSPFIYRLDEDGERVYNPDYAGTGDYFDAIYEGYTVR